MEALQREIETRRAKNNLLAQAVVKYRREFGDDLTQYPEPVANYARIHREIEQPPAGLTQTIP
jgi:hypothetical protein